MKKMMAIFLTMALASAISACGSATSDKESKESNDTAAAADEELVIHATNFKFDKEEYHLDKGKTVKITLKSQGMHGITIDGLNVNLKRNNASKTVTLDKAGTYQIKCSIVCGAGHKDMVAKLVVD